VEKKIFNILPEYGKMRLDMFLLAQFPTESRNHLRNLIDKECVKVEGNCVKAGYALKKGQTVEVTLPDPVNTDIVPQNIPLDILYQDNDLLVINKAQGMVVHPSNTCFSNTLVNALLYSVKDLSGINGELRPGIVHRLDKDTTGVMLVAKNDNAHKILAKQISEKSCVRQYISLLCSVMKKDSGEIITRIGRSKTDRKKMSVFPADDGREAISLFRVITRYEKYTLVEWTLRTGRTHQIRVHAKYMGHPVVADPMYGTAEQFDLKGQLLHSQYIKFKHPTTKKMMEFTAPLPDYFQNVLKKIQRTKLKVEK